MTTSGRQDLKTELICENHTELLARIQFTKARAKLENYRDDVDT